MKKLFSITTVALLSTAMFAITEQDAREYFQRCILSLDPIEGCYSVEYRGEGQQIFGSAWSAYVNTSLASDHYIVKMNEERDGKFLICCGDTQKEKWQYYYVLERVGSTNVYKLLLYDVNNEIIRSCHTYMEDNNLRFVVNFSGGSGGGFTDSNGAVYRSSSNSSFQLSFVKSYPSAEMYKTAQSEELQQNNNWSAGTAFALKNGYFVTNYHIYGNKKYAMVKCSNNNYYRAYFIAGDEANDIAIFQIRDDKFKGFENIPYTISNKTAEIGEEAWTIGYPATSVLGEEAKYTKGEINSLSGSNSDGKNITTNDTRLYQISTEITHGNSGGPLFDEEGTLIGITSSGWAASAFNNVNYALKSQFIFSLLESAGLRNIAPVGKQMNGQKRKDQIKIVKPYVFQVFAYDNKDVETELLSGVDTQAEMQEKTVSQVEEPVGHCDTIITIEGERLFTKIVDISSASVIYKDLQAEDNITAIEKSRVQSIVFANGTKQDYNAPLQKPQFVSETSGLDSGVSSEMYKVGSVYYYEGEKYQGLQYEQFLKDNCQQAYQQYKRSTRLSAWGYVGLGVGVCQLIAGGLVYAGVNEAGGALMMELSPVWMVCGFIWVVGGTHGKNTAYKTFNKMCHNTYRNKYRPDGQINLLICQNGIGLRYTF